MPLRIALSVWLTPWFARISILPFLRLLRRKKKVSNGPVTENTLTTAKDTPQDS